METVIMRNEPIRGQLKTVLIPSNQDAGEARKAKPEQERLPRRYVNHPGEYGMHAVLCIEPAYRKRFYHSFSSGRSLIAAETDGLRSLREEIAQASARMRSYEGWLQQFFEMDPGDRYLVCPLSHEIRAAELRGELNGFTYALQVFRQFSDFDKVEDILLHVEVSAYRWAFEGDGMPITGPLAGFPNEWYPPAPPTPEELPAWETESSFPKSCCAKESEQ